MVAYLFSYFFNVLTMMIMPRAKSNAPIAALTINAMNPREVISAPRTSTVNIVEENRDIPMRTSTTPTTINKIASISLEESSTGFEGVVGVGEGVAPLPSFTFITDSLGIIIQAIKYSIRVAAGFNMNNNATAKRTIVGSILKYSANPPHTPQRIFSRSLR